MSDDVLDDDASAYLDGLLADPHRSPADVVARSAEFAVVRAGMLDLRENIPNGVRDRSLAAAMAEFGTPAVAPVISLDQHRTRRRWLAGGASGIAAAAAAGLIIANMSGGSSLNVAGSAATAAQATRAEANESFGAPADAEAKTGAPADSAADSNLEASESNDAGFPSPAEGPDTGAPATSNAPRVVPAPGAVVGGPARDLGEQSPLTLGPALTEGVGPVASQSATGNKVCDQALIAIATWEGMPAIIVGPFPPSQGGAGSNVQVLNPIDCSVLATIDVP
jgi:hypothetical protein